MRERTLIQRGALGLVATLLALILAGAGVSGPVSARPAVTATPGGVPGLNGSFIITVDCGTSPERTTLANNIEGPPLDLSRFSLGSIVAPRGGEPFRLSGTLARGESRTYETGPGAAANRLSDEAIYDEADPREGVRLTGFATDLEVSCASRTGGRAWRADPPARRPLPTTTIPATGSSGVSTPEVAGVAGSPSQTVTPTQVATAIVPSLPATGVGGHHGSPWLSARTLSLGLLLVALGGAGIRRRRT